jgi:transposase InsO family protein
MQKMRLRALIRAKKRSRNVPGMSDVQVPNVLQRDFCATAPNQKWATDITEFNVNGYKLYLSACMDLYNGEIIAHRMARRPVFDLVSGTLGAALSRAGHINELTVHSDQGWHYKMQPYRTMLARCGVTQSMSRKGNCLDNAVIESFFGTLKAEYFYLATIESIEALEADVNDQPFATRLTAEHTLRRHQESLDWLKNELPQGLQAKTVVVTHHYPHKHSTHPRWRLDPLTAIFGSKLPTELLLLASLWIHGHSHDSCNYRIGDSIRSVRVVCNPRGYPLAWLETTFENSAFEAGLLVDVDG